MLKGVNKQIIEITNPPSQYFDKIIFIVSPNANEISQNEIENEANALASEIKKPPRQKITKNQLATACLNLVLGFSAGGIIMYLLNYFIK